MEIERMFTASFKKGSGKSHPLREDRDGSAVPCIWHGLAQSAPHLTGTGVHATLAQQKERMIII
jgi:hypothetical protein